MKDYVNFPILIIDDELDTDSAGGRALREIIKELKDRDFSVIQSLRGNDGKMLFFSHPNISCILIDWYLGLEIEDDYPFPERIIEEIRKKNSRVPIFLITDKLTTQGIPNDLFKDISGYIWKTEDTPHFIAGRVEEAVKSYINDSYPPFFKELRNYVKSSKYSWHTPGHSGGVAFLKTTSGRLFFDFFGENTLRSDLSVSVPELGSLLEHTEAIGKAEKFAARTFGADKTYFVTNGTSTANKIVFHSAVSEGDIVLVDRNCHKSIMHSLIMTGATPIYLFPSRNRYGIIGPIPLEEFDEKAIEKKLKNVNEYKDVKKNKIKLMVITNSTYDGLCYNVEKIIEKLKERVEVFHFDEAWYAYARFHELYKGRYATAIDLNSLNKEENKKDQPIIFSTHSTHKLLAAFSQASMIHVKVKGDFEHDRFNEAFMMHTSTSPQYSIIASLDAATKMMEESGPYLISEAIDEAIIFREKMVDIKEKMGKEQDKKEKNEKKEENKQDESKEWWFSIWQPEIGSENQEDREEIEKLKTDPKKWQLEKSNPSKEEDSWHGFNIQDDDYIMLDPVKVTVLTPGLNMKGDFEGEGIPACVVARFLRTRGIVVEKTGLYSFLILFSIGITKGKSGSLIAALYGFKKQYDNGTLLKDVFPEIIENLPEKYRKLTLKGFCQGIHDFYKEINIISITKNVYEAKAIPESALTPSQAYRKLVTKEAKREAVTRDILMGKISAVMLVPYPPGIPIIMPGERFNKEILEYLKVLLDFNKEFKDFEIEIHGLVIDKEKEEDKSEYSVYCTTKEEKKNEAGE